MRKLIIFVLLLSITPISQATEYFWETVNPAGGKFPSAQLACDAVHNYFVDNNQNKTPAFTKFEQMPIRRTSDTVFVCETKGYIDNNGSYFLYSTWSGTATRWGTTCPEAHTYNAITGECDPPEQSQCEQRAGQEISFNRTGKAPDPFLVVIGSNYANSTLACNSGCQISVPEPKCIVKVTGEYTCAGNATIMPIECPVEGGGDGFIEEAAPDVLTTPEPQITEEQEPCLYTRKPDGTWSCRSSESIEADGVSCGTANGQTICNPSQPSKDQTTIYTTVSTTNKPDGSSETIKTDNSTYVTCVGAKCTSSTSTTTTNTNRGPNGNIINSSTSCTGPNCMGNGSEGAGDGSEGPGGTGKCLVNCSESDEGSADFTGGELGEVSTIGDATGQFMERVGDAPIMQAVAGISLRGGGSCSFPSVSTDIGVIGLDFICHNSNWLDPLYYVFLAIWGLAAVRVLMSA